MGVVTDRAGARKDATVAIVGVGGLGAPAALALAHGGVGTLILIDDDAVDRTNLGRQILFGDRDVGQPKLASTAAALERRGVGVRVIERSGRLTPATLDLVAGAEVVVECSDNYATKFLSADLARLRRIPIVHGAAIRWVGTAFAVGPEGGPCYRCVFEEIPPGAQAGCDVAGVVGPVCGVVGALQAHFALRILDASRGGAPAPFGTLATVDGLRDDLRVRSIMPRPSCALCGPAATIDAIEAARYQPQTEGPTGTSPEEG